LKQTQADNYAQSNLLALLRAFFSFWFETRERLQRDVLRRRIFEIARFRRGERDH